MLKYRLELKENREAFLADLRGKYGHLPKDVEDAYLRKAMAIQNETRGKLGELMGEVSLTATGAADEADIVRDKAVFKTPFGDRRIDVWDRAGLSALEVKSGYTCLSRFVRRQIAKDRYLLEQGQVKEICWRFMQGASKPLLTELEKRGIEHKQGWPDLNTNGELNGGIAQSASLSKGELQ